MLVRVEAFRVLDRLSVYVKVITTEAAPPTVLWARLSTVDVPEEALTEPEDYAAYVAECLLDMAYGSELEAHP